MRRRSSNRSHFRLSPLQAQTIHDASKSLSPPARHDFLLHVGRTLQLSATSPGFVTDELVRTAISKALGEVAA